MLTLAGLGVASLAAWLAPLGWPFELFVHFRPQYGVAAALLAIAFLLMRRPGFAVLATLIAAVHLWPGGSGRQALASGARCNGDALTVVTANLDYHNTDSRPFIDWLTREPADLVLLQEVTPEWAAALEAVPGYPHRRLLIRTDPYGLGVLSRWPTDRLAVRDLAADGLPSLVGSLAGRRPDPDAGSRAHSLALAARTDEPPRSCSVEARAGDPAASRRLDRRRRLQPDAVLAGVPGAARRIRPAARRGRAAPGRRAGVPTSGRSRCGSITCWSRASCASEPSEVGPEIGSDHRPVRVRLRLPVAG